MTILNQKAIDAINKAKQLGALYQELRADLDRKETIAYATDINENWAIHSEARSKVSRLERELFSVERIILNELGVVWQ